MTNEMNISPVTVNGRTGCSSLTAFCHAIGPSPCVIYASDCSNDQKIIIDRKIAYVSGDGLL